MGSPHTVQYDTKWKASFDQTFQDKIMTVINTNNFNKVVLKLILVYALNGLVWNWMSSAIELMICWISISMPNSNTSFKSKSIIMYIWFHGEGCCGDSKPGRPIPPCEEKVQHTAIGAKVRSRQLYVLELCLLRVLDHPIVHALRHLNLNYPYLCFKQF